MDRLAFFLIWVLVFTIPWANIIFIPEIGTVSRIVGLPVLLVAVFTTLYYQTIRFHWMLVLLLVFAGWSSFTYFWSIDAEESEIILHVLLRHFLMVWMIFQWVTSAKRINALFLAYVFGAYVSVMSLMSGYLSGDVVGYQRYTALGFNPNDVAYILAFGIPLAWYNSLHESKVILSWFCRIYPALALIAIILTGSRGGFIVAMIGFLFVFISITTMSFKEKSVFAIIFVVAATLFEWFIPIETLIRINTIGAEISAGSLNSRIDIWKAGVGVLGNDDIGGLGVLWGKGVGCFPQAISSSLFEASAHNVYLSMLVEVGVIGFLIYIVFLLTALISTLNIPKIERLLWLVLLSQWGIAAMSSNLQWSKVTWLIFAMLIAHAAITTNPPKINTNLTPKYYY